CVGCLVGHLFMFLVGGKTPDQSVHLNLTTTSASGRFFCFCFPLPVSAKFANIFLCYEKNVALITFPFFS
ncbi:hypothetical protein ACVQH3_22455, partial [Klebsiella pneumoniae]